MTEHCGVFRTEAVMRDGLAKLKQLQQQYDQVRLDDKGKLWNSEVIEALELRSLMIVGEMILTSALNRQESRGSHSREDFPIATTLSFLKHTLTYYSPAGIDIAYKPGLHQGSSSPRSASINRLAGSIQFNRSGFRGLR